jgi:putative flippase GtrA
MRILFQIILNVGIIFLLSLVLLLLRPWHNPKLAFGFFVGFIAVFSWNYIPKKKR